MPRMQFLLAIVGALTLSASLAAARQQSATADAAELEGSEVLVVVVVNGEPVTEGDLEFLFVTRRVPEERRSQLRERFLEQLIERRLIRQFLDERKVQPPVDQIDAQVQFIRRVIAQAGDDPDEILSRMGYSDESLRRELILPLAWTTYARLMITPRRLREYFARHRRRFDGTEVRARQIYLKARTDQERAQALARLEVLRTQILGDELTFEAAARRHSEAPTRAAGGDVGFFPFRGKMPREFTEVAFGLKPGETSQPFATQFGVHLVTVIEEKPGMLSLEDVRRDVFEELSNTLWDELVEQRRSEAQVEWKVDRSSATVPSGGTH